MAILEQLALQLSDLPLATLLCKTFFNLSIGAPRRSFEWRVCQTALFAQALTTTAQALTTTELPDC